MNAKIGDYIRIVKMEGEPKYKGKVGIIESIDDAGQLHGTWGGCAIIPETDKFVVAKGKRAELYKRCDATNTSKEGIDVLLKYYIRHFGWTEVQACGYIHRLFDNGTIDQIKMFGKDGKEL